jgi:hypothetical protein
MSDSAVISTPAWTESGQDLDRNEGYPIFNLALRIPTGWVHRNKGASIPASYTLKNAQRTFLDSLLPPLRNALPLSNPKGLEPAVPAKLSPWSDLGHAILLKKEGRLLLIMDKKIKLFALFLLISTGAIAQPINGESIEDCERFAAEVSKKTKKSDFYCEVGISKKSAFISAIGGKDDLTELKMTKEAFLKQQCEKSHLMRILKMRDVGYVFSNTKIVITEEECTNLGSSR